MVMDTGTEIEEETSTEIEEETRMEMKEEMETGMGLKERLVWQDDLRRWNQFSISVIPHQDVRNKIQKMESELWNLTVKGNDVAACTQSIQRNVTSFAPTRLHDDIRMASNLMDRRFMPTLQVKVSSYWAMYCEVQKLQEGWLHDEGLQGHYKSECPKLNNQNRGNQVWNNEARGRAFALGGGEANQDSNFGTGTFLLNNFYASILFDSGVDRSFVSTTFSSLIDIIPTELYVSYVVELADDRVVGSDSIIRGCTLNLLNHPFNKDLMPVELGSFNSIIGMDWLSKYYVVIVCDEKIFRIPMEMKC
ncbi:reverse transcriptase domain-containing protein [Tanacetum coccineum]